MYVACGGLNNPHGTHAIDCVNMAIDMLRVMKQFRTQVAHGPVCNGRAAP